MSSGSVLSIERVRGKGARVRRADGLTLTVSDLPTRLRYDTMITMIITMINH